MDAEVTIKLRRIEKGAHLRRDAILSGDPVNRAPCESWLRAAQRVLEQCEDEEHRARAMRVVTFAQRVCAFLSATATATGRQSAVLPPSLSEAWRP